MNALGIEEFRRRVEAEWRIARRHVAPLEAGEIDALGAHFRPPPYRPLVDTASFEASKAADPAFARWVRANTTGHRHSGYRAAFVSLKAPGAPPGDMTAEQMEGTALLAERYGFGLARTTHDQNLLLADVALDDLHALWQGLSALDLATPNVGTLTNMICCPGWISAGSPTPNPSPSRGRSTHSSTTSTTCTTLATCASRSPGA